MFKNSGWGRCRLETLEAREVPAVMATLIGSTLVLQADNATDSIVVTQEHNQVVVNGINTTVATTMPMMNSMPMMGMGLMMGPTVAGGSMHVRYAPGAVRAIEYFGGAGNDIFVNDTSIGAFARGGSGNDVLVAGHGHDNLFAGTGNDILVGGTGPSMLFGGSGRDIFVRGPGGSLVMNADPAKGDQVF